MSCEMESKNKYKADRFVKKIENYKAKKREWSCWFEKGHKERDSNSNKVTVHGVWLRPHRGRVCVSVWVYRCFCIGVCVCVYVSVWVFVCVIMLVSVCICTFKCRSLGVYTVCTCVTGKGYFGFWNVFYIYNWLTPWSVKSKETN